ncbi:MAG: hypothetical protein O2960_22885, partial [Verrucomicrobia bacterium]|nr:hypothetical protein [Verrucomicrobiota bacterium]
RSDPDQMNASACFRCEECFPSAAGRDSPRSNDRSDKSQMPSVAPPREARVGESYHAELRTMGLLPFRIES